MPSRTAGRAASRPPADHALLPAGARLLFLYDGWCGVCARAVAWLRGQDREQRIAFLPSQTPGLAERAGLTRAELNLAAWVIDRDGRQLSGAAAVNRGLIELPRWRWLAPLYNLPVAGPLEDAAYRLFARHRGRFHRWGRTPGCAEPGADCIAEGVD